LGAADFVRTYTKADMLYGDDGGLRAPATMSA
jgi:hypothetical protein